MALKWSPKLIELVSLALAMLLVITAISVLLYWLGSLGWPVLSHPLFRWRFLPAAIGVSVLFFGFDLWKELATLRDEQNAQTQKERQARAPLSEGIGLFAAEQLRFKGLLNLSESQWQDWARRRFQEVIQEWAPDFQRFAKLTSNLLLYRQALADWNPEGIERAEFEAIWSRRQEIYAFARYVDRAEDRYAASFDRKILIETTVDQKTEELEAGKRHRQLLAGEADEETDNEIAPQEIQ